MKQVLIFLVLLHILVISIGATRAYREVFRVREIPRSIQRYTIPEGAALSDVLKDLHEMELAPAPLFVRFVLAWRGKHIVVKKGNYVLPERASPWMLLELFDLGRVELHKITLPEGLDKWQVAKTLGKYAWGDEATFLTLIEDPALIQHIDPKATDLEGYLFPDTYLFPKEATPVEIITTIVGEFIDRSEPLRQRLGLRALTVREWVALASMIERESSVPAERATISGVFVNRLKRGMLLQCDPTIIYSLKRDNLYKGKIYKSQIKYKSSYNTYVFKGLPPGPIASPSIASLQAALEPEQTPYLYFVAKQDGTHHFSKTLKQHNRAVRKYRRKN